MALALGVILSATARALAKKRVGVVDTGRFWCLYCEAECSYQLRQWVRARFVRCDSCAATFDPECLDESCTKTCEELMVEVPDYASGPAGLPAWDDRTLAEYLGHD